MLELNPLEVLNVRQVKSMPKHFAKIEVGRDYDFKIVDWIRSKLTGRYSIAKLPSVNSNNNFKTTNFVGFENEKELTYFMLACPYLRRN